MMRRFSGLLLGIGASGILALLSCHAARSLAPAPPLAAASAALYAVEVEFAEPLDRASAEEASRYTLLPASAAASAATVTSATLIDTLYGRTVQLVVAGWFGDSTVDRADWVVSTHGVRDAEGRSTGERSVAFRTGLGYSQNLRALFDDRCSSCHGAAQAGGNYRTDSDGALFGVGLDATPNLIASDPNCLLVRKCKPRNSMFELGHLSYLEFEMIRNWAVIYAARP